MIKKGALLLRDLDGASSDAVLHLFGALAIDGAANRYSGTKDFHDGALEGGSEGLGESVTGNLDDLSKGDVAAVLDVLDLLAVTWGLLEGADEARSGAGGQRDGGNTVLNDELAGHLETLPILGALLDIFTDLLGVQTQGANLRGESSSGGNFTTNGTDDDDFFLRGIELGGHVEGRLSVIQ